MKADPRGAGFAAVLANVNDIAAMGAVPMGIVDTIATSPEAGRLALAGMRTAAGLLDVPIVGGHLTAHDGEPAISAFAVGSVTDPALALSVTRAQPGQSLVVAAATVGTMNATFPFFRAFEERGDRCAGDVRLMPRLAREGVVVAAKDISMAGLVGSLAMLLEARGLGVTVDVDAVPAPPTSRSPGGSTASPASASCCACHRAARTSASPRSPGATCPRRSSAPWTTPVSSLSDAVTSAVSSCN
ncbi:AIR synthase related protein [Pseudonocardia benzenivorans]